MTSDLIDATAVQQLDDSLDALKYLKSDPDELRDIDLSAKEGGIDLCRGTSVLYSLTNPANTKD